MTWTPMSEPTQDPDNNWTIPGVPIGEPISVPARYAPVQSKEIKNADNNVVLQKGKVFIPKGSPMPAIGTVVSVEPNMFEGDVLDVFTGQIGWRIDV